jgi:hypothetical protein
VTGGKPSKVISLLAGAATFALLAGRLALESR